MDHCDSSMLFRDLAAQYQQTFYADLSISQLQNELSGFVEVKYLTATHCRNFNLLIMMWLLHLVDIMMLHSMQISLVGTK